MTPGAAEVLSRPAVADLLEALATGGCEVRLVGGAVRDIVMGRAPGDIDVATPLLPDEVMARARRHGWKVVPTGIAHGTVTVIIDDQPFEVTTLRRDVATDGRHATVAFTDDFREDALRRDFALNALSLGRDGRVHDYATGIADAAAGRIRFMGNPETRIREDYLRILRFFRFQASYGRGEPDADGLAACAALGAGMTHLSRERVRQELLKLLVAPRAADAVDAMTAGGIWPHILQGLPVDAAGLRRWTDATSLFPEGPHAMSALAALIGEGLDVKAMATALRLSRQESAVLALMRKLGCQTAAEDSPAAIRRAVYATGPTLYRPVLRAGAAWLNLDLAALAAKISAAQPVLENPPSLPFGSADVAALGIPAGPGMGEALARAESLWLAEGLPVDPTVTAAILRHAVAATD